MVEFDAAGARRQGVAPTRSVAWPGPSRTSRGVPRLTVREVSARVNRVGSSTSRDPTTRLPGSARSIRVA